MLEANFTDKKISHLLKTIKDKIPSAAYISLLLFKNGALMKSINNNYNNWRDHYTEEDMKHDEVFKFFSAFQDSLKNSNETICFWNSIYHTTNESLKIQKKKEKFGLHHGVTILKLIDKSHTIGINITSNNTIDEDTFYSKVILKRKFFIKKLTEFLGERNEF